MRIRSTTEVKCVQAVTQLVRMTNIKLFTKIKGKFFYLYFFGAFILSPNCTEFSKYVFVYQCFNGFIFSFSNDLNSYRASPKQTSHLLILLFSASVCVCGYLSFVLPLSHLLLLSVALAVSPAHVRASGSKPAWVVYIKLFFLSAVYPILALDPRLMSLTKVGATLKLKCSLDINRPIHKERISRYAITFYGEVIASMTTKNKITFSDR